MIVCNKYIEIYEVLIKLLLSLLYLVNILHEIEVSKKIVINFFTSWLTNV